MHTHTTQFPLPYLSHEPCLQAIMSEGREDSAWEISQACILIPLSNSCNECYYSPTSSASPPPPLFSRPQYVREFAWRMSERLVGSFDYVTPSTWLDVGALQDLLPHFPQQCDRQYFLRLFQISKLQNAASQWRRDAKVVFWDLKCIRVDRCTVYISTGNVARKGDI